MSFLKYRFRFLKPQPRAGIRAGASASGARAARSCLTALPGDGSSTARSEFRTVETFTERRRWP